MAINPSGVVTTLTVTNLHSNASSATNMWVSQKLTKASGALDALVQIKLDFANTAPANSKGVYVYALASLDDVTYTQPWAGSEGDVTVVDITANILPVRQIGFIPYTTADEVVEWVGWFVGDSGLALPPYYGYGLVNHSGAALASSGNEIKSTEYTG